ncbi:hypothetical protein N7452_011438 [Penicillium brevicompactum]|uniref:Uncharacterized protein n=1 Tax=Penicillium brevicompactum TaxID=5074 RepID=A0A9W9U925_PENBR|nr:hypothetical protein N7452_011438 [Penicillium brevicompactum]
MSPNIEDNSNLDLQALEGHVLPSLVHKEPDNGHNAHKTPCRQKNNNSQLFYNGEVEQWNQCHRQSEYNQISDYTESGVGKEDLQHIETRPISSFGTEPIGINRVADADFHN